MGYGPAVALATRQRRACDPLRLHPSHSRCAASRADDVPWVWRIGEWRSSQLSLLQEGDEVRESFGCGGERFDLFVCDVGEVCAERGAGPRAVVLEGGRSGVGQTEQAVKAALRALPDVDGPDAVAQVDFDPLGTLEPPSWIEKPRYGRAFRLPDEGLEPPTRGL